MKKMEAKFIRRLEKVYQELDSMNEDMMAFFLPPDILAPKTKKQVKASNPKPSKRLATEASSSKSSKPLATKDSNASSPETSRPLGRKGAAGETTSEKTKSEKTKAKKEPYETFVAHTIQTVKKV
jgi:hypothetical protein